MAVVDADMEQSSTSTMPVGCAQLPATIAKLEAHGTRLVRGLALPCAFLLHLRGFPAPLPSSRLPPAYRSGGLPSCLRVAAFSLDHICAPGANVRYSLHLVLTQGQGYGVPCPCGNAWLHLSRLFVRGCTDDSVVDFCSFYGRKRSRDDLGQP